VGFPGETDEDFDILMDFLKEARLDRVGCFQYSPVQGARANQLPDPVDEKLRQERWDRFMQTQAEISRIKLQEKVGKDLEIIIDDIRGDEITGRSHADAPEIDGKVFTRHADGYVTGDIVSVRIDKSDHYDLWGSISGGRGESR
jgi:ribosomal protein S12 methylthiotransferase